MLRGLGFDRVRSWVHRLVAVSCAVQIAGCSGDSGLLHPSGPVDLTITVLPDGGDAASVNATLVGFQDGDGPWVALGGVGGVYHAVVTAELYGVAIGCGYVAGLHANPTVQVFYRAISEGAKIDAPGCFATATTTTLSGSFTGISTGERGEVWVIGARGGTVAAVNQDGTYRLTAPAGRRYQVTGRSYRQDATRVIPSLFYRGFTDVLTEPATLDIDLGADGRPVPTPALTLENIDPSENLTIVTLLVTPLTGSQVSLISYGSARPDSYAAVDASQLEAGDLVSISARATLAASPSQFHTTIAYTATTKPMTVSLPPVWTGVLPAVTRSPGSALTVTLPTSESTQSYTVTFTTGGVSPVNGILEVRVQSLLVSRGYVTGQSTVTLALPDLSGLTGWQPELAPFADDTLDWLVARTDSTIPFGGSPGDRDQTTFAGVTGRLDP